MSYRAHCRPTFTRLVGSERDVSLFSKEVCVSEEIPLDHLEETFLQLVHKLIMSHSVSDHLLLERGPFRCESHFGSPSKADSQGAAKRAHCTKCGPRAEGLRKNTANGEGAGKRSLHHLCLSKRVTRFILPNFVSCFLVF